MCNISSYFLTYLKSQQNLMFYIDIDNNKKYTMDLQRALNKILAEKEKLEKENIELNYKLKTEISGTKGMINFFFLIFYFCIYTCLFICVLDSLLMCVCACVCVMWNYDKI